jgi:protein-tyrosine phosphatase
MEPSDSIKTSLTTFANLPPNTDIHLDESGCFRVTGSHFSILPGVQSLANWSSGHSLQKLAEDIDRFKDQVIKAFSSEGAADLSAYSSLLDKALEEGVPNLIATHVDDAEFCRRIETSFLAMKALGSSQTDETPGFTKFYLKYVAGWVYNRTMSQFGWEIFNHIASFENGGALFLGGLPVVGMTESSNDLAYLKKMEVNSILSVVENFEIETKGYIYNPVKPSDWQRENIKQMIIPTPDFQTIPIRLIQKGVEYIHSEVELGNKILIHCKAGRGRSALLLMCYLIKYQGFTAESAFALVREKRPHAGFKENDAKMITLKDYEKLLGNL